MKGREALTRSVHAVYAGRPRTEVLALLDLHRASGPASGMHAPEAAALVIATLIWCDELVAARRSCSAQLAHHEHNPVHQAAIRSQQVVLALAEGRLAEAVREADAVDLASEAAVADPLPGVAAAAGALAELALGDHAAAAHRLGPETPTREAQAADVFVLEARGWIELAAGQPARALDWYRASLRLAGSIGLHNPAVVSSALGVVYAQRRMGRTSEAAHEAADALERARAFGAPSTLAAALRAAAGCAPRAAAIGMLEEAVGLMDGSVAGLARARGLLMLGTFLRRDHRPAAARQPLSEALDLAARLGAEPMRARALQELRAVGARPRRERLTGVASLTAAEWQVADHAARGMSNNEVAAALVVTPKTIEWHLGNVYSKLGIKSRRSLGMALEGDRPKAGTPLES